MKIFKPHWQTLACCTILGFSSTTFGALSCGSGDYANCFTNDAYSRTTASGTTNFAADIFKASWEVTGGNTLNVNIQAETTGWVAIGFHQSNAPALMDDTDYVMGGYDGTTSYGGDYFYSSPGPNCPNSNCAPTLDGSQDVSGLTASETNGVTSLRFSRLLTTTDLTGDYDLNAGPYDIIWAFRKGSANGDDLAQYHNGGRNVLVSNFALAPVPVPAAVWLFGSAMLGFVGSAKYRKNNK